MEIHEVLLLVIESENGVLARLSDSVAAPTNGRCQRLVNELRERDLD